MTKHSHRFTVDEKVAIMRTFIAKRFTTDTDVLEGIDAAEALFRFLTDAPVQAKDAGVPHA
jgi:hypothetical protein